MHKNTNIQKPKLEIIKIFLCDKNLFIIEKIRPPAVFPIKANDPINPISTLLHSILNSLTQLYSKDSLIS